MEIEFRGREIIFNKELNGLDKFVVRLCKIFDSAKIEYVIISGYVSILFGRTRGTEDIDLFVENFDKERFQNLHRLLEKENLWVVNTTDYDDAFDMLKSGLAIRIAETGSAVPNFEIKFPKKESDFYSLQNKVKVILNGSIIYISPIEVQIAYKLRLGGEKDIEDSVHLYKLLEQYLDKEKIREFCKTFGVENMAKKYLGGLYEI